MNPASAAADLCAEMPRQRRQPGVLRLCSPSESPRKESLSCRHVGGSHPTSHHPQLPFLLEICFQLCPCEETLQAFPSTKKGVAWPRAGTRGHACPTPRMPALLPHAPVGPADASPDLRDATTGLRRPLCRDPWASGGDSRAACLSLFVDDKHIPCTLGVRYLSFTLQHKFKSSQWISILNLKRM